MNKVVAVIPTRGIIFSQTIKSLQKNGIYDPIIIEGLPIPDCHNQAVLEALERHPTHVLMMEEDMVLPDGALEEMLSKDEDIVAVDYPVDNGYGCIARYNNEILWCGLGSTLIKSSVFRNIKKPWFETDHSYRIEEHPFSLEKIMAKNKYGSDINFCMKARESGFKIEFVEGIEAKHLRSPFIQRSQNNSGLLDVIPLKPISKRAIYK